jgi:hypothetical protein
MTPFLYVFNSFASVGAISLLRIHVPVHRNPNLPPPPLVPDASHSLPPRGGTQNRRGRVGRSLLERRDNAFWPPKKGGGSSLHNGLTNVQDSCGIFFSSIFIEFSGFS